MLNLTETLSFDQAKMVVETTENDKGEKDLYLKGICIQGGVRNANQRVYPVTEIGRMVDRDHTTILDSLKKFNNRYKCYDDYKDVADSIFNKIRSKIE